MTKRSTISVGRGQATNENHSVDGSCINPGCPKSGQVWYTRDRVNNAIGVKLAPYPSENNGDYAIVYECPDCFTSFWHHTREAAVRALVRRLNRESATIEK